ncbi:MAG: hypothetical protein WBV21_04470, partial [Desulfobacterales bacterium]
SGKVPQYNTETGPAIGPSSGSDTQMKDFLFADDNRFIFLPRSCTNIANLKIARTGHQDSSPGEAEI